MPPHVGGEKKAVNDAVRQIARLILIIREKEKKTNISPVFNKWEKKRRWGFFGPNDLNFRILNRRNVQSTYHGYCAGLVLELIVDRICT